MYQIASILTAPADVLELLGMSFKSYVIINKSWDKTLTFMVINAHLTPLKLSQSRKTTSIEQRPWVFKRRIFLIIVDIAQTQGFHLDFNHSEIHEIQEEKLSDERPYPVAEHILLKPASGYNSDQVVWVEAKDWATR